MTTTTPRLLSTEQTRMVLESHLPHLQIAKQLGCSAWTVAMIRYGDRYADVLPEIPRWERQPAKRSTPHPISCWTCVHCQPLTIRTSSNKGNKTVARCGLGLPDPIEEGARFARFCNAFVSTAPETQTEVEGLEVVA
jgi:hypothetical protein